MPQTALQNIGLNYNWEFGADAWRAGMNHNLAMLDLLCQARVTAQQLTPPVLATSMPGAPADGEARIVNSTWATAEGLQPGAIGYFAANTGWHYANPREGWVVYEQLTDRYLYWSGQAWVGLPGGVVDIGDNSLSAEAWLLGGTLVFKPTTNSRVFQLLVAEEPRVPPGTRITLINAAEGSPQNHLNIGTFSGNVTWLGLDPGAASPNTLPPGHLVEFQKLAPLTWVVLRWLEPV